MSPVRPLVRVVGRPLVAEPCETGLPIRDPDRVEPGGRQVPRHALGDYVVVLDDENLRHACIMTRTREQTG